MSGTYSRRSPDQSALALVSLLRRNGKFKRNLLLACVMFGLFIAAIVSDKSISEQSEAIGTVASNDSSGNQVASANTSASDNTASNESAKKAEEEATVKAEQEEEERKKAEEVAEKNKPKLELLEHGTESDGFIRYIVGKIQNNTNKEYSYVQVEINLYDEEGSQVGSTLDNMNNLEPGGIWKFKAPVFDNNVTEYKIKDITGF